MIHHFCYNASFRIPWVLLLPMWCATNKLGLLFGVMKSMFVISWPACVVYLCLFFVMCLFLFSFVCTLNQGFSHSCFFKLCSVSVNLFPFKKISLLLKKKKEKKKLPIQHTTISYMGFGITQNTPDNKKPSGPGALSPLRCLSTSTTSLVNSLSSQRPNAHTLYPGPKLYSSKLRYPRLHFQIQPSKNGNNTIPDPIVSIPNILPHWFFWQ